MTMSTTTTDLCRLGIHDRCHKAACGCQCHTYDPAADLLRRIRIEANYRPSPTGNARLASLLTDARRLVAGLTRSVS